MGAAYGIGNCCEIFGLKPPVNYPSTVLFVQRWCCTLVKSFWKRIQVTDEYAGEKKGKEKQCMGCKSRGMLETPPRSTLAFLQ